jgi:hypothetical protein
LADVLVERGYVLLGQDGGIVTAPGEAFFADLPDRSARFMAPIPTAGRARRRA